MFGRIIGILVMQAMVWVNISAGYAESFDKHADSLLSDVSTLAPKLNIKNMEFDELFGPVSDSEIKQSAGEMLSVLEIRYVNLKILYNDIKEYITANNEHAAAETMIEIVEEIKKLLQEIRDTNKYPSPLVMTINGKYFEDINGKYQPRFDIPNRITPLFVSAGNPGDLSDFKDTSMIKGINDGFQDLANVIKFLNDLEQTKNKIIYSAYRQIGGEKGYMINVAKTLCQAKSKKSKPEILDSKIIDNIAKINVPVKGLNLPGKFLVLQQAI